MNAPIHIETDILIDAPPDRVWAKLVDLDHYSEWNGYLVRVEGRLAAGETLLVHSDMGALDPLVAPVTVVSLDPPHAMRWEGGFPDRAMFKGDHWWELSATDGGGTRVRHHEFFTGSVAVEIVGDGERIRHNFERMNRDLKASIEGAT